jgi:hypothetical protein
MNCARSCWTRRISAVVLAVVVPTLAVAQPAAAAYPVTPAHLATDPPAAERTLPHLSFVCPTAIGDHKFAGLLPDGPVQEQCFYDDGHGSNFGIRVSWETTPVDPSDTRAVCAEQSRTSWHEEGSNADTYTRSSTTRRAAAGVVLNLYWPTKEKLARQKALLAQSQALGEELLAAAEKLAQPCLPAAPTTSASPSDSPSPSQSPEPTPTDQEVLCESVVGRLTDDGGRPVKGIVIRLSVPGERGPVEVETQTDDQGSFRFGEIPDTEQARARDAARLVVLVRDGSDMWRLYAGNHEATLVTKPFPLHASGGCRHDLTTTSLDGYTSANPETAANWADLWTVVAETRRALAYATTELGVELRDLPVVIYAWCPPSLNAKTCTPSGYGAFAHDRTPTEADHEAGLGSSGRVPHIALAPQLTDALSEAPEDDTVYHELGHIIQADLAGGFTRLVVPDRTNHAGYRNASSNDSWIEGFASWFAISLRTADGRRKAYYQWRRGEPKPVENDVKAWDANGKDEEWAVAGLLTDLTDAGTTATGDQGRPVPFTVTGDAEARLIDGTARAAVPGRDQVLVDLYDAAGTLIASDEAYLFPGGRFLDVPAVSFARARVTVWPAGSTAGRKDDDPFTISPRNVVRLITGPPDIGTRGKRKNGASVVFDMAELHSVLRSKTPRPGDVDALFIAHGFHENLGTLENRDTYLAGAAVGVTTHPPFDPVFDPRYSTQILPEQYVKVDTGALRATVVVFPQNGVPYAATPDTSQRVPVLIPGSRDSRAAVVTLADGARPTVTVIEGKTFWPEAARNDGRPFLTIQPKIVRVAATTSGSRSDALVLGAGAALLAFGSGAAMIGVSRRRRHRRLARRAS